MSYNEHLWELAFGLASVVIQLMLAVGLIACFGSLLVVTGTVIVGGPLFVLVRLTRKVFGQQRLQRWSFWYEQNTPDRLQDTITYGLYLAIVGTVYYAGANILGALAQLLGWL